MMMYSHTPTEERIVSALKKGPLTIEDLTKTLNLPKEHILSTLHTMQREYDICYRNNKYYIAAKTNFVDWLALAFVVFVPLIGFMMEVIAHG